MENYFILQLVKLTLQSWYLNKIAWIRKSGGQDSAESLSNSFICELAAEHQMCARKNFWSAVTNEGDTGKKRLSAFKRLKVPDKSYIIFPLTNVILFSRSVWNVWRVYWGGISGGNCLKLHKLWDCFPWSQRQDAFSKGLGDFLKYFWKWKEPKSWIYFYQWKRNAQPAQLLQVMTADWSQMKKAPGCNTAPRAQASVWLTSKRQDCSSLHAIKCLNLPSPL